MILKGVDHDVFPFSCHPGRSVAESRDDTGVLADYRAGAAFSAAATASRSGLGL
jgi:hypothetical protein